MPNNTITQGLYRTIYDLNWEQIGPILGYIKQPVYIDNTAKQQSDKNN